MQKDGRTQVQARLAIRVCRVAWLGSDPVHPAILGCSKKIAVAVSGHCPKGICSYFCPRKRPSKTRTWGRSGLLFRSLAKRSLRSGAPPPTNPTRQLCCFRGMPDAKLCMSSLFHCHVSTRGTEGVQYGRAFLHNSPPSHYHQA